MSTFSPNLTKSEGIQMPNADVVKRQRFAIIVAQWNSQITHALQAGALQTLLEAGAEKENIKIIPVPGTIELTYAAAKCMGRYDAIIVIGCVIKGDTPHFDYVCQSVTQGVTMLNQRGETPVIFSVITTLNLEQAQERAGGILGNKGAEGAQAALLMAQL